MIALNETVAIANSVNDVLIQGLGILQCDNWGMPQFYDWMFETTCDNMINAWFFAILLQIIFIVLALCLWKIISCQLDNHDPSYSSFSAKGGYNQLDDIVFAMPSDDNTNGSANDQRVQEVGSINSSIQHTPNYNKWH